MKNSIQIDYVRNISAIIAVTCQKIHYVQLQVAFFFRIWKQSSTQGSNQVPHKPVTQFANTFCNNEPLRFLSGEQFEVLARSSSSCIFLLNYLTTSINYTVHCHQTFHEVLLWILPCSVSFTASWPSTVCRIYLRKYSRC